MRLRQWIEHLPAAVVGDLTSEEYAAARDAGFMSVALGPTVLRADNAALACAAITQALANR